MIEISISLGSNIDPKTNLIKANELIKEKFNFLNSSHVYSSKSAGFVGDDFLNLVTVCSTNLKFDEVISTLKAIESSMGRKKEKEKFSDRLIDLDLLTYGNEIIENSDKEVPHKDIEKYSFVLVPLAEVMPNNIHPKLGIAFIDLLETKNFKSEVTKVY